MRLRTATAGILAWSIPAVAAAQPTPLSNAAPYSASTPPAPLPIDPGRSPHTHPLLPTGLANLSVGATFATFAALESSDDETAAPLAGAAAGAALSGVLMIAAGTAPVREPLVSEDLVVAGGILAGAGSTAAGLGAAWEEREHPALELLAGGAVAALGGTILLAVGAQARGPDREPGARAALLVYSVPQGLVPRSRPRATAGKILCGIGVGLTAVGAVATAAYWEDSSGYVILISGPVIGSGALLGAIGAPLWATGNALVPAAPDPEQQPEDADEPSSGPEIEVGVGSVAMRWRF